MLVQPYERPVEVPFPPLLQNDDSTGGAPFGVNGANGNGNDAISRFLPPCFGGGNAFGSTSTVFSQLGELLEQLVAMLGQLASGLGGPGGGNQEFFQHATGSSTGDPHLSFNNNHWDSMASQPNLLDSNSFPGGLRISTQATQPGPNGVTYNENATITSDFGNTRVSLDKSGALSIVRNGEALPIDAGQTLDLGNGETMLRTTSGVRVTSNDGRGGQITTVLNATGSGVDVSTTGTNVDLGGALVRGLAQPGTYEPNYGRSWL